MRPAPSSSTPCRGRRADSASRRPHRLNRYELEAFQALVRQQFDVVGRALNDTHGAGKWVEIDAGGAVDEVRRLIWDIVQGRQGDGRQGSLWEKGEPAPATSTFAREP